uniref:histidine kinase n=1 Tax=Chromera velia CCMP2878 TaxID=1169474 RepID=A0A0G4FE36_9ALVE|eukprot:Cvel_3220.t1-p1 / transcript=Cvel_3220.t1 / gene=Cvel_3220 / organism=Chromera_velia_CCMP2878 / gene_product=Chemotaxis protein CheY, putative / transcript_product=Chemotaxis protein CheY, putative / location=Cvel_scaffold126:9530-14302(-) / protein_length=889 / sequence_SO=supercontig / SO=protein_coding / is_pseudo=false
MAVSFSLVQASPLVALSSTRHFDWVLTGTLCAMAWSGQAALCFPPSTEAVPSYTLIQGAAVFFHVMLACGLQLPDRCFYTYMTCVVSGWLAMRFLFISYWIGAPSSHDYMATCAVANAAVLMSNGIRNLTDEALESFVKSDAQRQNAEEQKHSFLAYIMHEVRNPLNVTALLHCEMLSLLEGLEEGAESARKTRDLEKMLTSLEASAGALRELGITVQTQLDQMGSICNDVLHLEQLTAGRFQYNFVSGDLKEFFLAVAREASRVMQTKGVSLEFDSQMFIDPHLAGKRLVTWADFNRLRQVLANFFSNAQKFTPLPGRVVFSLHVSLLHSQPPTPTPTARRRGSVPHFEALSQAPQLQEGDGSGKGIEWVSIRFGVRDSGIGISAEELPRIFKAYHQIRTAQHQTGGGTGLGLCISRVFVEAHSQGKIGASSEGPNKGTELFFEFSSPLEPTKLSFSPQVAYGSPQPHRRRIQLPSLKEPPASPLSFSSKGILHVSSPGTASTSAESSRASPTPKRRGRVSFPALSLLDPGLPSCFQEKRTDPHHEALNGGYPFTADVLVVEDNILCQLALTVNLKRMGFSVAASDDGSAALLRFQAKGERFRLVLCDRNMPNMEGPEAIEKIRAHCSQEGEGPLPIFLGLTGQTENVDDFAKAGALTVLFKPVTKQLLEEAFAKINFSLLPDQPLVAGPRAGAGESGKESESSLSDSKPASVAVAEAAVSQGAVPQPQDAGGPREGHVSREEKDTSSSPRASAPPLNSFTADILLVEDNALCQMAVSMTLKRMGYSVATSDDGSAAVERYQSRGERFRLVLCDRNMPNMEGPEAIEKIRAHCSQEGEGPLPIFLGLTGQTERVDDFAKAGALTVLFKPVTKQLLEEGFAKVGFSPGG